jgi:hypothetical protein
VPSLGHLRHGTANPSGLSIFSLSGPFHPLHGFERAFALIETLFNSFWRFTPSMEIFMTLSLNDFFQLLLRPFREAFEAQQALNDTRPELSLEDLRALQRLQLEQDLARERLRTSTALSRPFGGLL